MNGEIKLKDLTLAPQLIFVERELTALMSRVTEMVNKRAEAVEDKSKGHFSRLRK